MNELLTTLLLLLLLVLLGAMWRAVLGPSATDRLVAIQVVGTLGIGVLLLLARVTGEPAARDAALLMAVLSLVITMTFVRRWPATAPSGDDND